MWCSSKVLDNRNDLQRLVHIRNTCEVGIKFSERSLTYVLYKSTSAVTDFRFISCPNKIKYFKAPVNIIDITATLTFYIDLILASSFGAAADLEFFSIIRIMRLFKLTQHSQGLKILLHTFRSCNGQISSVAKERFQSKR